MLDSYRLAKYYQCSPEIFLAMPLSEIEIHMRRTIRLAELMRAERNEDG